MNKKRGIISFAGIIGIIVLTFVISSFKSESAKTFNVLDYGAKGDGVTDNSKAFTNCMKEAVKSENSVVIIPYGNYKINTAIDFYFTDQKIEVKGVLKGGQKPVIFTDNYITLFSARGYSFPDQSKGSITISNLKFSGKKSVFSAKHPYVKKNIFFYGIYVADKNRVDINNVEVNNIYGQGIGIINTSMKMDGKGRFAYVSIANSSVLDCWGYNPQIDNYGDGIYVGNTITGNITNNIVKNNPAVTKQLGRGGIVLEYFADAIVVQNNKVSGYDRGIHIEETNGGQQVIGNTFTGTDLGVVVYENEACSIKFPILIKNNVISNENFNKSLNINRVRMPRAMLNFLVKDNCRAGSIIEGNTFLINRNYQFVGNSMANILANGLIVRNNKFVIGNSGLNNIKILINDEAENTSFINNTFDGLSLKKKSKTNSAALINQNNFLRGAKIQ